MFAKTGNILLKLALALVIVAGIVVAGMAGLREAATVEPVKLGPAVHAVSGSVTVFADKDLQELKSEVGGRVVWCAESMAAGKPFQKGDPLMRLDRAELDRKIAKTKRDYEANKKQREILRENNPARLVAQQNLDNALRLQQRGADVSDEQVNTLRRELNNIVTELAIADLKAAKSAEDFKSEITEMEELLEKMTVRATAAGVTEGVMVAEGSLISAGATVLTFYRNERVVVAKIGEEDFGHIKLGQPAKVRLLIYGNQEFDAKVSQILPYAEPQTQLYTIHLEVDLKPAKLLPNSTGEVTIEVGRRENQPLVPRRAVISGEYIYVVHNGRVEKRAVELGYVGLNLAEIRKGVTPGELVVVENLEQFRPGQRVTVTRAP